MKSLGHCLRECAVNRPGRRTSRRIIITKSKEHYDKTLTHLTKLGIKPVKTVRGSRMLCLHLDKASDWSLLKNHPHVSSFEPDVRIKALGVSRSSSRPKMVGRPKLKVQWSGKKSCRKTGFSVVPWNIRRVGAPVAWLRTLGGGVRLAIIDTGVGPHPDLSVSGGINVIDGKSFRDNNGHGTHVAGIAAGKGRAGGPAGVAPAVSLYAVKALNAQGSGNLSDIIEGIDWCINHRMNVINMSFGVPPGTQSTALHNVIRRAYRAGIVLVAAAGNSGVNSGGLDIPGAYPEVISVAASSRRNKIASFSSRGKGLDLTAPGVNIFSTWLNGTYTIESGTSMSSPHVAGGSALLLSVTPGLPPGGTASVLKRWARRLPGYGPRSQGSGLLQLQRISSVPLPLSPSRKK